MKKYSNIQNLYIYTLVIFFDLVFPLFCLLQYVSIWFRSLIFRKYVFKFFFPAFIFLQYQRNLLRVLPMNENLNELLTVFKIKKLLTPSSEI